MYKRQHIGRVRRVTAGEYCGRRLRSQPRRDEAVCELRQRAEAHEKHQRPARPGQGVEILRQRVARGGAVRRDYVEAVSYTHLILGTQIRALAEAFEKSGVAAEDIAAIGVTNQRETSLVWDRTTGKPVYNAIVWQCRRTAAFCDRLAAEGVGAYIRDKTGLLIDAYFSGTKIRWILDNVEGARERAERGELLSLIHI